MRTVLALLAALAASGCTGSFFQPHRCWCRRRIASAYATNRSRLRAGDGVDLVAWFMPAHAKAHATVLFLHGNAENISTHFLNIAWMPAEGFNVLALDYRGYGASTGTPSLRGVQLDIDAALAALRARPDVDPRRIVLFGQSLGGALAIHYGTRGAHRGALRAVIADSAFADYVGRNWRLYSEDWWRRRESISGRHGSTLDIQCPADTPSDTPRNGEGLFAALGWDLAERFAAARISARGRSEDPH